MLKLSQSPTWKTQLENSQNDNLDKRDKWETASFCNGEPQSLSSQDSAGPVGKTILASQPAFTENLSNGHLETIHISDKFVQSIELNSAVRCSCIT